MSNKDEPDYPFGNHRDQEAFEVELVDETVQVLADIRPFGYKHVYCQILNGVTALDTFQILTRPTKNSAFEVMFETTSDFTTPDGQLIGASGDLTALGVGSVGSFKMHSWAAETIRVQVARAAGGASTVKAFVGTD